MEKFLETFNLPRLNQGKTENLNRPITIKEIELEIKNLPVRKSPGPEVSSVNFTRHLKN